MLQIQDIANNKVILYLKMFSIVHLKHHENIGNQESCQKMYGKQVISNIHT